MPGAGPYACSIAFAHASEVASERSSTSACVAPASYSQLPSRRRISGIESTSAGSWVTERVAQRQRTPQQQRGVVLGRPIRQQLVDQAVAEVLEVVRARLNDHPKPLEPRVERLAGPLHQPVRVEDESGSRRDLVAALLVGRIAGGPERRRPGQFEEGRIAAVCA